MRSQKIKVTGPGSSKPWLPCGVGSLFLSRMYSHIQLASKLSSGCDYALFKVSSAPVPPPPKGQGKGLIVSASPFWGAVGWALRAEVSSHWRN